MPRADFTPPPRLGRLFDVLHAAEVPRADFIPPPRLGRLCERCRWLCECLPAPKTEEGILGALGAGRDGALGVECGGVAVAYPAKRASRAHSDSRPPSMCLMIHEHSLYQPQILHETFLKSFCFPPSEPRNGVGSDTKMERI